jgi:hypothetical protein
LSPSLETRTWGRATPADLTNRRPLVVLVAAGLIVVGLIAPRLGLPAKVPPLTIDNPTPYTLFIEASNGSDGGWAPIAIVHAKRTDTETELIDEGATWNLRFTGQGVELGGYHVTRAELAADHWHYTVPSDVARRLEAKGVPVSP